MYLFLRLFTILASCLSGIVGREAIVGGFKVETTKCRYYASIFIHGHGHSPRCGGGIINDNFIITAARCVIEPNGQLTNKPISILVGTCDLSVAGEVINVTKIVVPLDYNHRKPHSAGDIAVLKLQKPLEKIHEYKQLLLPSKKSNALFENKTAQIAGFGWDKVNEMNELIGEHTGHQLRYADAEVRTRSQCQQDHPHVNFTEKHLCARIRNYNPHKNRFGTCIGDEGGPLVLKGRTVIGILSMTTIGCSEKTSSAIYTRVSSYRDLINIATDDIDTIFMRVFNVK